MKAKRFFVSIEALFVVLIMLSSVSCTKDEATPDPPPPPTYQTTPYVFNIPDYFPIFEVPVYNPTTVEGVELGKRLYYDPMLSIGGPLEGNACATCHVQSESFSTSTPHSNQFQVMQHVNLNYTRNFLWDGLIQGELEDICEFEVVEFSKLTSSCLELTLRIVLCLKRLLENPTLTRKTWLTR